MVHYTPPSAAELRALATSGIVGEALSDAAEDGKAHARSIAPVDSGTYRDSFYVEQDKAKGWALLINDVDYAGAVEWGKGSAEGHHTLAKTADYIERGG